MSVTRNALMNWLIDKIPPAGYTPAPPLPPWTPSSGGGTSHQPVHDSDSHSAPPASPRQQSRADEPPPEYRPRLPYNDNYDRNYASRQQEYTAATRYEREPQRAQPPAKPKPLEIDIIKPPPRVPFDPDKILQRKN